MIKGSSRKIIRLKDTGSDLFDEALFFLREDGSFSHPSEADMIREANRIVSGNLLSEWKREEKMKNSAIRFGWFLAGACTAGGITALLMLLLRF